MQRIQYYFSIKVWSFIQSYFKSSNFPPNPPAFPLFDGPEGLFEATFLRFDPKFLRFEAMFPLFEANFLQIEGTFPRNDRREDQKEGNFYRFEAISLF